MTHYIYCSLSLFTRRGSILESPYSEGLSSSLQVSDEVRVQYPMPKRVVIATDLRPPSASIAHHFLSANVNGQLSCSTISNPFLIPFLEESHLTIGKIVAKTLISSDCGVAWCVQSSNKLALPRNSAKLSCA